MRPPNEESVLFPVPGLDAESLYAKGEAGDGGLYPVGANDYWHGGVHLRFETPQPLVAVQDGELLAYRFDEEPSAFEVEQYVKDHKNESNYSRSFVLLKHKHLTPKGKELVFYALYMHLCSAKEMKSLPLPQMFQKRWKVIGSAVGGAVDLLLDPADSKSQVGHVPKDGYLSNLGETAIHYKVGYRGNQHFKGVALLPKGFDKTRIQVKNGAKWDAVKIEVRDPDDKTKLVGYVRTLTPEDRCVAKLRVTKLPKWKAPPVDPHPTTGKEAKPPPPPPPKHWYDDEKPDETIFDGYWTVDFETHKKDEKGSTEVTFWVEGYVEKGRCISLTSRGFVLAGEGINVYERRPGEVKEGKEGPPRFVPKDFLPKGGLISFKDPAKVKNGEYVELDKGGYVLVDTTTVVEYEGNVQPVYGSVETPRALVKKGETVGYAGPYLFDRHCVHFEIVTGKQLVSDDAKKTKREVNESVCENAAGDEWGWPLTVWIDKGATFKKKKETKKGSAPATNPPIAVDWRAGSILRILDTETTPSAKDLKERYYKMTRAGVMGWVETKALEAKARIAPAPAAAPADDKAASAPEEEEEDVDVPLGHASVKTEISGLWLQCPSVVPSDIAKPVDLALKIPANKDVVVVAETHYLRCRFPDIEVEKTAEGYVDPDAVQKGALGTAVAGLFKAWPSKSAEPDLTDGCPLAVGSPVVVLHAGSKSKGKTTYSKIRYKYTTKQTFEGWLDARHVEALPADKEAPAERRCELRDKVAGLFTSPPASLNQKLDVKHAFEPKTSGVILEDSKRFSRIVHKLDGEKIGWSALSPNGRSGRYQTRATFGGDLLDDAAYFDNVGAPLKVTSLLTDNPNASTITFEEDAGTSTETMRIRLDNWIDQVVQRRWLDVGDQRYIEIDPKDGPNLGKVHLLSPYDWPGWMVLEEDKTKEFSKNGFCDVPDLLELVQKALEHASHKVTHERVVEASKAHTLTVVRIKQAFADQGIARQLRRMSCLHPTEWDGDADDELGKYDELKERCGLSDQAHKQTLEHIKKLQFWLELKGRCPELPDANAVWHYHPIGFLENLRGFIGVNEAQLKEIVPKAGTPDIKQLLPHLNAMMFKYGLNTRRRQAHFLAQCAHESFNFSASKEGGSDEVFEKNYGYRGDLSNFIAGDGKRFPGRGLIQMTGRLKYMRYGAFVAENFADTPGAGTKGPVGVEQYPYRCDSAGWVWMYDKPRDSNSFADVDDFEGLSKNVNGGYNDLDRRAGFLLRAKKVLMG